MNVKFFADDDNEEVNALRPTQLPLTSTPANEGGNYGHDDDSGESIQLSVEDKLKADLIRSSLNSWIDSDLNAGFESILFGGPLPPIPEALNEDDSDAEDDGDLLVTATQKVLEMRASASLPMNGGSHLFGKTFRGGFSVG